MKSCFFSAFIAGNAYNNNINGNNIISISPGGKKGLYYLGTLAYIKSNYDLHKYSYLGSSAGAWCSLYMCFNGNDNEFINDILSFNFKSQSLYKTQHLFKRALLSKYTEDDFDLHKLNIGIACLGRINKFSLKYNIYNEFNDLEDAIDCCIASSHIPIITGGGLLKRYKKKFVFDGGLIRAPYRKLENSTLHISPEIWNNKKYIKESGLSSIKNFDHISFYNEGYSDAEEGKSFLDTLFTCNTIV